MILRRLLPAALALSGCRIFSPLPDMRTAADHAREASQHCKDDGLPGRLLAPDASAVDSVEPAYARVHSGSMDQARLRGARIHVRPLPGYGKEALGRAIECHEVRVTLGSEPPLQDDPYVLPDRWLDIDVESDRDGFVVLVRVNEFEDAREILARARRFAAR